VELADNQIFDLLSLLFKIFFVFFYYQGYVAVSLYRPAPIMNTQQAEELLDRYLDGSCTPRERALLEAFYRQHADSQDLPSDFIDFYKVHNEQD
jgi:hypothetical protein